MKVIPFNNEEEAKAFLREEEQDLIWKARSHAKSKMLLGIVLIALGMFSFILGVVASLHKFSLGAFGFGVFFLVKGVIDYFTKEVDEDFSFKL